ncbi:hypothetical protein TNCV_2615662 [Trichonephila clavipes]|nr:hypothetical protein TNCV_2615662 [Trichonephila clavipes]
MPGEGQGCRAIEEERLNHLQTRPRVGVNSLVTPSSGGSRNEITTFELNKFKLSSDAKYRRDLILPRVPQPDTQGNFNIPHNYMTCVPTSFTSRNPIDSSWDQSID